MRKRGIVAIIIIILIILCIFAGVFVYMNMNKTETTPTGVGEKSSGLDLDIETGEASVNVHKSSITMPGWTKLSIPANTTENITVDFYNPEQNKGLCYLTFELKLADTGETLYKSGLVQPGDHKRTITLSRPLEKGTYNGVVHIQPYTLDDNRTELNSADVELLIVVS